MGVSLVRMNPDAGPDVIVLVSNGDDRVPLALPGGDVEEALDAASAGVLKHFVLPLDEAFVIEVAMAIDQPHSATSSASSSSASRGNSGVGGGMGAPPSPASRSASSLAALSGIIGAIA